MNAAKSSSRARCRSLRGTFVWLGRKLSFGQSAADVAGRVGGRLGRLAMGGAFEAEVVEVEDDGRVEGTTLRILTSLESDADTRALVGAGRLRIAAPGAAEEDAEVQVEIEAEEEGAELARPRRAARLLGVFVMWERGQGERLQS